MQARTQKSRFGRVKGHPKSDPKTYQKNDKNIIGIFMDFWRFWEALWSQHPLKINQKIDWMFDGFLIRFWMDFGRLLGTGWEPKRHLKVDEILDAILGAKKEASPIFWGRPGGMCRVPGGNNRGVQGCQNCRRDEDQGIRNSRLVSSTPSLVGRRIAPRIPPGWDSGPKNNAPQASWIYRKRVVNDC